MTEAALPNMSMFCCPCSKADFVPCDRLLQKAFLKKLKAMPENC